MTTIAVTGASGFVARHLIPLLLENGHEVRGLARNAPEPSSGATAPGFTFTTGDVRDANAVRSVIRGCDWVVHLAASFSPEDNISRITIEGTERVLEACKDAGVKRLVVLSCLGAEASSHSPFYAAKWRADALVRGADVPHVILRPSLVVGRGDGVTNSLAVLLKTLPFVPVPGHGEHRMQPIDVNDMARCIVHALSEPAVENEVISVGGPAFITFRQLIDLVAGHLGASKPKLLVPLRLLPMVACLIPISAGHLYTEPRLAQFGTGVVASPGIVDRTFGFQPRSVVDLLGTYLTPA